MSLGKSADPSGIVAEMLKAASSSGASMLRDLIEDIIFENRIPSEWQKNHIVSVYKGKSDALNRSNYRCLKLIDQVMKVLERVVEGLIRQKVVIICNVVLCKVGVQLMPYLSSVSYRKSIWLLVRPST